jgi:hypothetical protein
MKTVFPFRPRALRASALHAGLGLLALAAWAVPAAAQPSMSRGEQRLPISYDECMQRAVRALQAEGYTLIGQGGAFVHGFKDIHGAYILCNVAPEGTTWANIVVASSHNDAGVPGAERQRLQARMNQSEIPPAVACSGEGAFGLAVSPSAGAAGTAITVSFTAPGGRPTRDWVGLFQVGATGHVGQWHYTNGQTSGTLSFYAPHYPGAFEFRYLLNDGYDEVTARCGFTVPG